MIRQSQQPPQAGKTSLLQSAPRVLRAPLRTTPHGHSFAMPAAPVRPPID